MKYRLILLSLLLSMVCSLTCASPTTLSHQQQAIINTLAADTDLPAKIDPLGKRAFVFSPRIKEWAAYDPDGYRVAYGRANGGAPQCEEDPSRSCSTPSGVYTVYYKGNVSCVSSKYPLGIGGWAMPYCMFFYKGLAIHGSEQISLHNGSHGCIRVQTNAARWLHHHFIQLGTKVIVLPY